NGLLNRAGRALAADVAEIRRDVRSLAVDAMAGQAAALALEHRLAARDVAERDRLPVEIAHVSDVGDDAGDFRGIEPPRRHRRSGDSLRDDAAEIIVGGRALQLAALQGDAANLIALRPMAGLALRGVDRGAVLNVGQRVLAGVFLRGKRRGAP